MHVALDRFALLTQLPDLPSLDDKTAALVQAAYATVACTSATVVVFGDDRVHYAHAPGQSGFTLREHSRGARKLFIPSLSRFAAHAGCYVVPAEEARAFLGVADATPAGDTLVVPLETTHTTNGALIFQGYQPGADEQLRELRTFADVAALLIEHERQTTTAEREAKQSALLALINERARKSLDRQSILESVVEDIRRSFGAMRCAIFQRESASNEFAIVVALAESAQAKLTMPSRFRLADSWLEHTFAGSVVSRERVTGDVPRDHFLRLTGAGSALLAPLVIDGRIEHAIALQFDRHDAFDDLDIVMLRSVGSHVGLALANVQLYDLERLRRARAESLERVVRMVRDTQTIEEVLLVFAVTVSHEVKLTCAIYELEGSNATRRAVRTLDTTRTATGEVVDASLVLPLLERDDVVQSSAIAPAARFPLFTGSEGVLAALRIDGTLWGFVVFSAPPGLYDWGDSERRIYFHMLASHLELALSGALGFERVQHLARALSESNEFKDDLLAMLAHDFKGPLTVILGYCELLIEHAPESVKDEIETIYSQTKRLVRLAEDAVALAQTQAGGFSLARTLVDLRDVVAESIKAHNRGQERIAFTEPDRPVMVSLDVSRFNHVLDNLLMNAIKYSQEEIDVRIDVDAGNATLTIRDRGIGIPQAELATVFQRFGRATNARRKGISGSGVGLYVSRKIVEVHGGTIGVQSAEGEGSIFIVTLPLAGQQTSLANGT